MKRLVIGMMLLVGLVDAKGISLVSIFNSSFGNGVSVMQKNIKLKSKDIRAIQLKAKAKIDSKKIRFYLVKKSKKTVGYGVLLTQRVRTKKASILYLVDTRGRIKSVEIITFKEPSEYKPNSAWMRVFKGKSKRDNLVSGRGIPTITGATMSARTIANASRIALAIVAREKGKY